jgi:signal peptidase II
MTRRLSTHVFLLAMLVATIGCDRVTKQMATVSLANAPARAFFADTVRLVTGLLLAAASVALLRAPRNGWVLLGTTLFPAGGASNWVDRVVHGHVVDFLNLGVGLLRTGIFNVADVAITAGLVLLVCAHSAASPPSGG